MTLILDRMSINNILIFIKAPKQISDAMGHDLETHLKSYSRFNTKDLENAFDFVVED